MGDLNRYNYDNMHNWLGMGRIVVGTKDVCTT